MVLSPALLLERLWPVERRAVLARGHRMDLAYLVAYALLVLVEQGGGRLLAVFSRQWLEPFGRSAP